MPFKRCWARSIYFLKVCNKYVDLSWHLQTIWIEIRPHETWGLICNPFCLTLRICFFFWNLVGVFNAMRAQSERWQCFDNFTNCPRTFGGYCISKIKTKENTGQQIRSKIDSLRNANFLIYQPNPMMLPLIGIVSERRFQWGSHHRDWLRIEQVIMKAALFTISELLPWRSLLKERYSLY